MIKNERQFRTTKTQAEAFRTALVGLGAPDPTSGVEQLKWQLQHDAIKSQYEELKSELNDYEALQAHAHQSLEISSFDDLPDALVKARIAAGLTQRQLADRLGMKEQQVQRYESNGYLGANLSRIQEVVQALGIRLKKQLIIPELPLTVGSLVGRLEGIGFKRDFIEQKLLNPTLRALECDKAKSESGDAQLFALSDTISRIYGWDSDKLFSTLPLNVPTHAMAQARFKVAANAQRSSLPAYTVYAHYLALLMLQATSAVTPKPIPLSWRHVRQQIVSMFGEITLLSVVRYMWSLGVAVLPLNDPGSFHGATWRVRGRNVVVVKQKTASEARWIIDLLHELWHAGQDPDNHEHATIEAENLYMTLNQQIDEEIATDFAADVVFKGKADELAEAAAKASNGRIEWLKGAVQRTARSYEVRTDLLANHLAFRLAREDKDWWATAASLQPISSDPWDSVRNVALEYVDWDSLHGQDKTLLQQALAN